MLILATIAFAYDPVPDAVGIHLSAGGLDRIGGAVAEALPRAFPVGAIVGNFACDDTDPTNTLDLTMDAITLGIHVDDVAIVPSAGRIDITVTGTLDSTPATLTTVGDCSPLVDLDEACAVQLPAVGFTAHVGMTLALVDGAADAVVDDVSLTLPPINNPLDDCTFASAVGAMLGQDPYAISNLLTAQIEPQLADLGPTLESAVEDGLAALNTTTSFAIGAASIDLTLAPTKLEVTDAGLILGVGATISPTAVSDCVTPGTPPPGDATFPPMTGTAPDGALTYDAAVQVNKQLVDQLLYAVYEAGGLCIGEAGASSDLGGIALTTTLFESVFGDAWAALFPVEQPVTLLVRPPMAPTVRFSGDGAPIRLQLNGLLLRAFSMIDARMAKAFGIGLGGEIGLDVPFVDGTITPALWIDADAMGMIEEDHEFLPEGYADGLGGLLPTLLGAVIPADLLPTFTVPSWQGIGLANLWWIPSDDGAWLGVYALVDVEDVQPIELAGCSGGSIGCDGFSGGESVDLATALGCGGDAGCGGDSGCGGSGCGGSSGCATASTRPALFGLALLAAILRRRKA